MYEIKKEIIETAQSLPPISRIAVQLINILNDTHHSLKDVSQLIRTDSALSLKVLKQANLFSIGAGKKIETVEDAVFYMGDATILTIVLSGEGHIYGDLPGYVSAHDSLWKHSLKTALYSKYFMNTFDENKEQAKIAYTGGLLHDIGKRVLSKYLIHRQEELSRAVNFEEKERDITGISHSEVGCIISQAWNLPLSLREAICFHHDPSQATLHYRKLVYAVHLGDITSMISGSGTGIDNFSYYLEQDYIQFFPLSRDDFSRALIHVEESYKTIIRRFNLEEDE
ncbi:MAG: HDOD domain-containing protein [Fibrobacterota bacterium]